MVKGLVTGLCLAVFAAVIIGLSSALGLDLEHVALLGPALGGVLGLIPHRPAWGKVSGFLAGFLLAWLGFALRAAVLPDSSAGRAVAAFVVVALIAVVTAASRGRLPLWSGLVGLPRSWAPTSRSTRTPRRSSSGSPRPRPRRCSLPSASGTWQRT